MNKVKLSLLVAAACILPAASSFAIISNTANLPADNALYHATQTVGVSKVPPQIVPTINTEAFGLNATNTTVAHIDFAATSGLQVCVKDADLDNVVWKNGTQDTAFHAVLADNNSSTATNSSNNYACSAANTATYIDVAVNATPVTAGTYTIDVPYYIAQP
ncbi:hypothetical protein LJS80_002220 [Salmonella enterica]|nr:hypothetical protein [Salmonella enterica]EIK0388742.1 hypothetical protein [Salmonella enterica]